MPTDVTPGPPPKFEFDVESLATVSLAGAPTALVIDLDPVVGIHIASALNQRALACAVLIVPRWPHLDAVLPSEALIGTLVAESRRLRPCRQARHVVFVLDGERSKSIRRPALAQRLAPVAQGLAPVAQGLAPGDARIDNRYDVAVGELPSLRHLRSAGIERIVKLSPSVLA
jgi:hypothetical protein